MFIDSDHHFIRYILLIILKIGNKSLKLRQQLEILLYK